MLDNIYIILLGLTVMVRVKAFQVIGENRTAIQGQDTILPCKLTGEDLPADTSANFIYQIAWWKSTRQKPDQHNFFAVDENGIPITINGYGQQYIFNGSLQGRDGSVLIRNVRLLDEGMYTCIFTTQKDYTSKRANMHLTVLVPPEMTVRGHSVLGKEEVPLAGCDAANAKPSPKVTWDSGTLKGLVKEVTNEIQNANSTSTVVSSLVGVPAMEFINQSVQCVVTHPALETPMTLNITIQFDYPPTSVMINHKHDSVFECKSDAFPRANYTWRRDNQDSQPSGVKVVGGILAFSHHDSGLNGIYICEASNSYGRSVGKIYVFFKNQRSRVILWLILGFTVGIIACVAFFLLRRKENPSQNLTPSRDVDEGQRPSTENERLETVSLEEGV